MARENPPVFLEERTQIITLMMWRLLTRIFFDLRRKTYGKNKKNPNTLLSPQ
jgi:hypothetical protein